MSSKNIIEKINADYIAEANEVRSSLLSEASSRADEILNAAKQAADAVLAGAKRRGEEEMRCAALVASLDSRKATLEAKRSLVEKVFEKVTNAIDSFDDDRWSSFMVNLISSSGAEGNEDIYVPESCADRFSSLKIIDKVNKGGKSFKYAGTTDAIRSGVLISGPDADINCSVDTLIADWRSVHEIDVSDILFKEEE